MRASPFDEAHHVALQLERKSLSHWEACTLDQKVRASELCLLFETKIYILAKSLTSSEVFCFCFCFSLL